AIFPRSAGIWTYRQPKDSPFSATWPLIAKVMSASPPPPSTDASGTTAGAEPSLLLQPDAASSTTPTTAAPQLCPRRLIPFREIEHWSSGGNAPYVPISSSRPGRLPGRSASGSPSRDPADLLLVPDLLRHPLVDPLGQRRGD